MSLCFVSIARSPISRNSEIYTNQYKFNKMQYDQAENVSGIEHKCNLLEAQIKRLDGEGIDIANETPDFQKSNVLELAALKILEGHIYLDEINYSLLDIIEDQKRALLYGNAF